jgi:predicted PolB exonuclease-like 3'-5' exonuclease
MVSKNPAAKKVRRLIYDIETSPNLVLAFRAGFKLNIGHDAIIQERKIICIGYKWQGEKGVNVLRWDKDKDDRSMLDEFLTIAEEADELVAHYGDGFDLPWIRTRCLILRLRPFPVSKTVDTKAWASRNFLFNSNKLDYLSKLLGHGGKEKMDFDDWKQITLYDNKKSKAAMDKMCHYCGVDVLKLEKVFLDFEPHVAPKSHAGVFAGKEKWTCPRTGSENVNKSKTRVTSAGTVQHQMKNLDTGTYFTISDRSYKDYLDAKSKTK